MRRWTSASSRPASPSPLFIEQVSRLYQGRESYSGDLLGRGGVILAWHPTDDVLLFLNDNRLRRVDCAWRFEAEGERAGSGRMGPAERALPGLRAGGSCGARRPAAQGRGRRQRLASTRSAWSRSTAARPADSPSPRASRPDGSSAATASRSGSRSPNTATVLTSDAEGSRTLVRRLDLISGAWSTVRSEPATVEFQGMPRDGSFLIGIVTELREAAGLLPPRRRFLARATAWRRSSRGSTAMSSGPSRHSGPWCRSTTGA